METLSPRRSLLIVEDEEVLLKLYSAVMSRQGWTVYTATTESEAVEITEREQPGVILTDYNLTSGNGIAVITKTRTLSPQTATVLISGYLTTELVEKALAAGAFTCLRKPVELQTIIKTVETALQRKNHHTTQIDEGPGQEDSCLQLRLASLADSTPHCAAVISPDYRIVAANTAFRERFGDDSLSRLCYEVVGISKKLCPGCRAVAARDSGQEYPINKLAPLTDTALGMVEEHVEPCQVEGARDHVLLRFVDLSRESPQPAQTDGVHRTGSYAQQTGAQQWFLVGVSLEGAILFTNDHFRDVFLPQNLSPTGMPFLDFCGSWFVSSLKKGGRCFKDLATSHEVVEILLPTPTGAEVPVLWEFNLQSVPGMSQPIAICMGASIENLRAVERMLRFYNACYEELFHGQFDIMLSCDNEQRITAVNNHFLRAVGRKRREILSQPLPDFLYDIDDVTELNKALEGIRTSGTTRTIRLRLRYTDGNAIPVQTNIMAVSDAYNVCEGYALVMRNVQDQEEFQRMLAHTEKMTTLGELSAGIVHQMNNYLQGIISWAEMIKLKRGPDRGIDEIIKSAVSMRKLGSEVMEFARKPKAGMAQPLNLNEMVATLIHLTHWRMKKEAIYVETELADEVPIIAVSAAKVEQVLLNLLTNAADAVAGCADCGDNRRIIHIRTQMTDDAVLVDIADQGPGIPPHLRESIFEVFFTTKEAGTGLGLSLARNIMLSLGGDLKLLDQEGFGAVFRAVIPLHPADNDMAIGNNMETH